MKEELVKLIMLHDFDLLLRDVGSADIRQKYKRMGFQLGEPSAALLRAREELTRTIDPKRLAQYERILHRYRDRAVAPVIDEFCGGCYSKLPAELVAHKSEILTCPNCGRFLYWSK